MSKIQQNFNTITNILLLLLLVLGGTIWADSNGVWIEAEDVKGGIFGSDEGSPDFTFPGNVNLNINNCDTLDTDNSGNIICGTDDDIDADSNPNNELQNLNQVLSRGNNAGGRRILNVVNPVNNQDVATKVYVDSKTSGDYVKKSGDTMSGKLEIGGSTGISSLLYVNGQTTLNGDINMLNNKILNLDEPIPGSTGAVNVRYLEKYLGSPPIILDVFSPGTTSGSWECRSWTLNDHCNDFDGCKIRILMQHETDGNDQVRTIEELLYIEQGFTPNNKPGKYGFTRQMGGGDVHWRTGSGTLNTIFDAWGWVRMYNYVPNICTGTGNSASLPEGTFTFATHPAVSAKFIIYD